MLNLNQLDEKEKLRPLTPVGTLTCNYSAVLRLAVHHAYTTKHVLSWEENESSQMIAKLFKRGLFPSQVEIVEEKLFKTVWQSKENQTSQWSFQARILKSDHKIPSKLVVLESVNSFCGVFRILLALPVDAWAQRLDYIGEQIPTHLHSC